MTPLATIKTAGFTAEQIEAIAVGNAFRLFPRLK
jgi:microsomal dipeptidase-like Zn-dependent dipeptidase